MPLSLDCVAQQNESAHQLAYPAREALEMAMAQVFCTLLAHIDILKGGKKRLQANQKTTVDLLVSVVEMMGFEPTTPTLRT